MHTLPLLPAPEWRACRICVHGIDVHGQRHCKCPAIQPPGASQHVELTRANTGACGPEAHHMSFPGLIAGTVDRNRLAAW